MMNRFTVPNNGRHSRNSDRMRIRRDQAHSQDLESARRLQSAEQVLADAKK